VRTIDVPNLDSFVLRDGRFVCFSKSTVGLYGTIPPVTPLRSEEPIDKDVVNLSKCLTGERLLVEQGNVTFEFILRLSVGVRWRKFLAVVDLSSRAC
jgi:hypothetical protein